LRVFFGTLIRKMGFTGYTGEPACGVKKQGVRPWQLAHELKVRSTCCTIERASVGSNMMEYSGEVEKIIFKEPCSLASKWSLAIAKLSRCLGRVSANLKLAAHKGKPKPRQGSFIRDSRASEYRYCGRTRDIMSSPSHVSCRVSVGV